MRAWMWIGLLGSIGCEVAPDRDPADDAGLDEGLVLATGCAAGGDARVLDRCDGAAAVVGERGFDTLQDAIDAAADGATVWLCPGRHPGSVAVRGRDLRIEAARAGDGWLDGGSAGRVIDVVDSRLTLRGLGLVDGRASPGGAILSDGSQLVLECLTIEGSRSRTTGGAIAVLGGGSLTVVDSELRGNRADQAGGAVGVDHPGPVDVSLDGAHLHANDAPIGAAVAVTGSADGGALTLVDATVDANVAQQGSAAIHVAGAVALACTACDLGSGALDNMPVDVVCREHQFDGGSDSDVVFPAPPTR